MEAKSNDDLLVVPSFTTETDLDTVLAARATFLSLRLEWRQ
jgi:hypothetical protein